jgi:pimeloyl-ACP methyl ester carboxylesterase
MGALADEGVMTADGRRIGYLMRGPANGQPVIYLHGMPSCRIEQRLFPEAVLDRFGIRLISIDRPGWGSTDPCEGDRIERSADVVRVCDVLELDTVPIVAVSAGGSYALAFAAANSDRAERVVLVSAQMPYDDESAIRSLQPDQLALLPGLRLGRDPLVVEGCEEYRARLLVDPMGGFAPTMATLSDREQRFCGQPWVRDAIGEEIREGLSARVDGLLDDLLAWPQAFEVPLHQVECPVHAVHGTADDWEPLPNLQRILAELDNSHLILLDGLNHFGPILYPDLVMSLVLTTE